MKGGYQNREKAMGEDELKEAYIKILTKYRMQGIFLPPISEVPIFKKVNIKQSK